MKKELTFKNFELSKSTLVKRDERYSIIRLGESKEVSQSIIVADQFIHTFGGKTYFGIAEEFDYDINVYTFETKETITKNKTGKELINAMISVGWKPTGSKSRKNIKDTTLNL